MALEFHDINYWVTPAKRKEPLHILKGVSGRIEPGRFYAFLGRSGSGKTTLLDLLAKRKQEGEWSGSITFDGKPIGSGKAWNRTCGYVLQHDKLMTTATVFETLMFSAQLRTPYGTTYAEHLAKVDAVLAELEIDHRRSSRIGSETARSLSGGEVRRVSIGVELVADVKVLLLDEPTSGLDSTTARAIVKVLQDLSRRNNRVVAATIHQPSSSITELFDDMMLLAGGRVCYAGPWADAIDHFAALDFPCPTYVNPSDFFMDLSADADSATKMIAGVQHAALAPAPAHLNHDADTDADAEAGRFLTPFWFQFRLLWVRSLKQWYRNELMLISELTQYIFCGLFIGIMYHSFSDNVDSGTFDRISAVFFVLTTICFVPSFTVITLSGEDRPLFKRETSSGMYRTSASFLAKMGTAWPFEIALGILFSACAYFLCGFQTDAGVFFTFVVVVVAFQLVSETIGLMCATVTPNPTIGVLLLSIVLLVCLALGGFLVSEPKSYYTWFEHINFFVFAYTAMSLNEFSGLVLYDNEGNAVDGVQVLRDAGRLRNNLSVWENVAVLVGILVVVRTGSFLVLERRLKASSLKRSKVQPGAQSSGKLENV